ncbi:DDE Tnp4 domain-containing protein [Trichonephila clavipes]|nr:DDE Tnp4 domain-containing protein [Trichonephila clavipes]
MDLVIPKMPILIDKQAQLSTEDANETRLLSNQQDNNIEDDYVIAQRMLDLVKKPNYLQQTVEENGWARKRAICVDFLSDSDHTYFPRLTWKDLRYLTPGVYQLK